jgi:hypothetical protein
MNDQLFSDILNVFLDILKLRSPGLECQLYLDRLHAHLQPAVAYRARKAGLWFNWYSAESSTFLQPADDKQFAVFHSTLNAVSSRIDLAHNLRSDTPHTLVLSYFWEALKAAVSPAVVISSFRNTGIFPWDSERIRQNAARYLQPKTLSHVLAPVSPVAEKATQATLSVLEAHSPTHKHRRLKTRPMLNKVYRIDELEEAERKRTRDDEQARQQKIEAKSLLQQQRLAAKQKRLEEKRARQSLRESRRKEQDAIVQEKVRQREVYKCKACRRCCRHRDSAAGWLWCEYCGEFAVCPYRRLCPNGAALMAAHEASEKKSGKKRLRKWPRPLRPR